MEDLRKLPQSYKNKKLTFNLLERTDKAAIYKSDKDTYEVIEIIIAEATTAKFGGGAETEVPRREVQPGDEKFGKDAFAFQTKEAAYKKYEELK